MSVTLSRPYTARDGAPTIDRVDPRIFTLTYFSRCMTCQFCDDACCQFGADIEMTKVRAIEARAAELEPLMGPARTGWFRTDSDDFGVLDEPEYPGGEYTRTRVVPAASRSQHFEEACVFLDPATRGCRLHRFALESQVDVHTLKPMVCILFPLCFAQGELHPALELETDELVCQGPGESLYHSLREELVYYFGAEMVAELDALDLAERSPTHAPEKWLISLPMQAP